MPITAKDFVESSHVVAESLGDLSEIAEGIKNQADRKRKVVEADASLFELASKDHRKFKQVLDKLFAGGGQAAGLSQDDEDDLTTVFEYFFSLCGLYSPDDENLVAEALQLVITD